MERADNINALRIRHVKNRQMTTIAVLTALAVVSRICLIMIPEVKPMATIVIITAVVLGKMPAFYVGGLTMLVSNFVFGQGPWTPWQMLGLAMVGFLSGILLNNEDLTKRRSLIKTAIIGGIITFAVYGLIVDTGSVFLFQNDLTFANAIALYATGAIFNAIHGVGTCIFLVVLGAPIYKKLVRIKVKYGIFN